jgi:hypothetical protein
MLLRTTLLAALALASTLAPKLAPPTRAVDDAPRPTRWDGARHAVHEWGTFTSVQGSNGVTLGGLTHDPVGLPPFVYDIRDRLGLTGASPKMETPVVYFYAPEAWKVRLRVDFPHGLLTQWYPAAHRANLWGKRYRLAADVEQRLAPGRETGLADGYLSWGDRGELLVLAPDERVELPAVDALDPWRFSREVAANDLVVTNDTRTVAEAVARAEEGGAAVEPETVREHERFLFYRGLGDFPLPLAAEVFADAREGDVYRVSLDLESCAADEPLRHVFLVYVDGEQAGFRALDDIVGRVALRDVALALRPREVADRELAERMSASLESTGLYTDEARAMTNTWRANWFGDPGLRVLYVLPGALVERELPLSVEPVQEHDWDGQVWVARPAGARPSEMVRTFVGRLDLMPPSFELELLAVLADLEAPDAQRRADAQVAVRGWGRYGAPYLERALALGAHASRLAAARLVLEPLPEAPDERGPGAPDARD